MLACGIAGATQPGVPITAVLAMGGDSAAAGGAAQVAAAVPLATMAAGAAVAEGAALSLATADCGLLVVGGGSRSSRALAIVDADTGADAGSSRTVSRAAVCPECAAAPALGGRGADASALLPTLIKGDRRLAAAPSAAFFARFAVAPPAPGSELGGGDTVANSTAARDVAAGALYAGFLALNGTGGASSSKLAAAPPAYAAALAAAAAALQSDAYVVGSCAACDPASISFTYIVGGAPSAALAASSGGAAPSPLPAADAAPFPAAAVGGAAGALLLLAAVAAIGIAVVRSRRRGGAAALLLTRAPADARKSVAVEFGNPMMRAADDATGSALCAAATAVTMRSTSSRALIAPSTRGLLTLSASVPPNTAAAIMLSAMNSGAKVARARNEKGGSQNNCNFKEGYAPSPSVLDGSGGEGGSTSGSQVSESSGSSSGGAGSDP